MTTHSAPLPPSFRLDRASVSFSLDPRDPAFVQNPYPAYDAIRGLGPLAFWRDYGHWVASGHETVSALFRDRRFGRQILHLASRAELGWPEPAAHLAPWLALERHSLLELEPPEHTRLRGLINRAFVSRQVARLEPRIAALARELIAGFDQHEPFELITAYATPIPVTVIAELIGVDPARAPHLLAWSHAMVAMYQFGRDRAVEDAAVDATIAFSAFLRELIAARRVEPRDDLVSHLIATHEAGDTGLSEDEMVTTCILLLNAGHEATVHAIANGVLSLLDGGLWPPPSDDASLAAMVEETLRHDAPLHMFTRYALEPCEAFGVGFGRGDVVGLLIGAANRDPARFADPARLDAERGSCPHLSFGAGIHFCVGAPLARLELAVAFRELARAAPTLRLAEPPSFRDSYHFHGLERLMVRLGPG
jgi:cytochrome P450